MAQRTPKFERPPIVELAVGVQFAPLTEFSSAHVGVFWHECLGNDWKKATDAPPLADQFELFGEQKRWRVPGLELRLDPVGTPRVQIANDSGDCLIQIQSTRFLYNWRKRETHYPSFEEVRDQFERHFQAFSAFAARVPLGKLVPNQWELTYVDSVPQGDLWQSVVDCQDVFPCLRLPAFSSRVLTESVAIEYQLEIAPKRGRLHIGVGIGRNGGDPTPTILLQFTARGPIGKDPSDLRNGLEAGHTAALEAFLAMASDKAKHHWGAGS